MEVLLNHSEQSFSKPEGEISLYSGELTPRALLECSVKVQKAFPALTPGFFEVFGDMLKINNFSDNRLKDAVDHVISNCIYPTPTIAQFISWDKRVKVYKYPEVLQMLEDGDPGAFNRYQRIVVKDLPEPVYIHVNDIAKYNIKSEQ